MTDNSTQSQLTQQSDQVLSDSNTLSSTGEMSATDRLEALLKNLQTSDAAQVKSQLSAQQPTVEQQLQGNLQSGFDSYNRMIQKISPKYSQGKPSLTELLQLFDESSETAPEVILPVKIANLAPAVPEIKPMEQPSSAQVGHDWSNFGEPIQPPAKPIMQASIPTQLEPEIAVSNNEASKSGLKFFMTKLTDNLNQFGRLKIVDFNAAN